MSQESDIWNTKQERELTTDAARVKALTTALERCMYFLRFSEDADAVSAYRHGLITKVACGGEIPDQPYFAPYPELDHIRKIRQRREAASLMLEQSLPSWLHNPDEKK